MIVNLILIELLISLNVILGFFEWFVRFMSFVDNDVFIKVF